ncbi:hypothetical protein VLK31_19285 [Variovorax sp. H27-G14]|uniref:hypothetical protein n=1 Tax=Variovorax sp. H27-G14 TaxID=3111914 RepID=UPI0038FC3CA7
MNTTMADAPRGSQFVHLEHYSLKASSHPRSKKGRANIKFIVDEMLRVPSASRHVPHVKPPTLLFGTQADIEALPVVLQQGAAVCRDAKGRKQRSDTPLLMGVIFSFPSKAVDSAYLAWERDTIQFARQHFGTRAVAIARHEDEEFPHLHVLVHDQGRSVHRISPGYVDGKRSRSSLGRFQDAYQAAVGAQHGLARCGPRREREPSTKEHKRVKAEIEGAHAELAALRHEAKRIKAQVDADAAREELARRNLARTRQALEASMASLQQAMAQRVVLNARRLDLEALEVSVKRRAEAMDEIERERFDAMVATKAPGRAKP